MKRIGKCLINVIVVLIALTLISCSEIVESNQRVLSAQQAIEEFKEIDRFVENFYDTLYLTENAEIHHNAWSMAYIKAQEAYASLTDQEKMKIENAEYLNTKSVYLEEYKEILIEQEIALYCKEYTVEILKKQLINKSSYEEYGWILDYSSYDSDDGSFYMKVKIEYSATNRVGGRVDSTYSETIKGFYSNGQISITDSY